MKPLKVLFFLIIPLFLAACSFSWLRYHLPPGAEQVAAPESQAKRPAAALPVDGA
jgi:hypothetical protein